jgi:predicted permease
MIPPEGQKGFRVNFDTVGRDYFQTLGTRIQRGRAFERSDELPDQQNAIISETMAKRFWPKADPIGTYLKVNGSAYQIVGVAQDNRNGDIHRTPAPFMYLPFAKMPEGGSVIIVETVDDPLSFAGIVNARIRAVDKMASISKPQTLKGIMSLALYQDKMLALFSSALGLLGISLAAIGLYAVVAYLTRCRTREIGIRIALGAQPADVSRMVLEDGFKICLIGIGIGAVIAFFAMRLIGDMLYGVAPTDIWTFAASCLVVLAAALLASYIPARRAARIDPMAALRHE